MHKIICFLNNKYKSTMICAAYKIRLVLEECYFTLCLKEGANSPT